MSDTIRACNLILGRPREASGGIVDFAGTPVPVSTADDIAFALKAMRAQPRIEIDKAVEALSRVGARGDWITDDHLVSISRQTGSTITYLRHSIARLNEWLAQLPESLKYHGHLSSHGLRADRGMWAGDLTTSLVLAGDATAVGPLALAHSVIAGARTIAKGSRREPLAPYLFLRALAAEGVPVPQLVFFDSSTEDGHALLSSMLRGTQQSVVYGADSTINTIYRGSGISPAHKTVGFWAGRSGVLVLPDADPVAAGRAIAVGTAEDRGNRCVSTMKAFVPASLKDAVVNSLLSTARAFSRGNPYEPGVEIGRIPEQGRQEALAATNGTTVLFSDDAIFAITGSDHYLLREELPYPVCCIRVYDDATEDPVQLSNEATSDADNGRALELAVFTGSEGLFEDVLRRTTACKVMLNKATTDLDHTTTHQGIYLFQEMMRFCAAM